MSELITFRGLNLGIDIWVRTKTEYRKLHYNIIYLLVHAQRDFKLCNLHSLGQANTVPSFTSSQFYFEVVLFSGTRRHIPIKIFGIAITPPPSPTFPPPPLPCASTLAQMSVCKSVGRNYKQRILNGKNYKACD